MDDIPLAREKGGPQSFRVIAIDHDLAFPRFSGQDRYGFGDMDCSPDMIRRMESLNDDSNLLSAMVGDLLGRREFEGVKRRLGMLLEVLGPTLSPDGHAFHPRSVGVSANGGGGLE